MISSLLFAPLIGALISGVFSQSINRNLAQVITVIGIIISASISYFLFYEVIFQGQIYHVNILKWIEIGSLKANWSMYVDSLTAVMLIVVTTISALVHIYSIGYMHDDHHLPRFMSYLSLFTFAMLMLVTSDNFLQLFFGWEGVGVCSYLLIGFWFKKESANLAAMKAFIVNRVSDISFILGIITVFVVFNNLEFSEVFRLANIYKDHTISIFGNEYHALTIISLLLFIGAMGKSAQLGLHTWLPDAMEGPTPVSALIHAATMVTAGVFLVARCAPIFSLAPAILTMITYVGAATCIFAATVAITQNDIKKIIAYSTCSQLGYMFFACGVSAFSAGIFHLMTHAFFKALLFLAAGNVIHSMSGEQDITRMGGIWKKLPFAYVVVWIGSLALAGFYPFAGYFSKDVILEAAYAASNDASNFAFWCGIVGATLTAFYSWRLIFVVFHGEPRASKKIMDHIHDGPFSMDLPLMVLAIGAIFVGFIGYEYGMVEPMSNFWHHIFDVTNNNVILEKAHHVPAYVKTLPLIAGISGVSLAFILYVLAPTMPKEIVHSFHPIYVFLSKKWFFDEIYYHLLIKPYQFISRILWQIIDVKIIDKLLPNGVAFVTLKLSNNLSKLQNGYINIYALISVASLIIIFSLYIFYFVLVN